MIKWPDAFAQKLDFDKIFPFCTCGTDVDGLFLLNNGIILVLEIKKETQSHTVENFLNTNQYQLLRSLIGNRLDVYFVYLIDRDVDIEASDCQVKFVKHCDIETNIDSGILLTDFIKDLSRYNDIINTEYYIVVRYPNTEMRYCVVAPQNKQWSTTTYTKEKNMFKNMNEVNSYILDRFVAEFNRKNEYMIYRINEDKSTSLIDIRRYNNK